MRRSGREIRLASQIAIATESSRAPSPTAMKRLRSEARAWSTEVSGSATRKVPILVPPTTTGSVSTLSLPVSSVEIVVKPVPGGDDAAGVGLAALSASAALGELLVDDPGLVGDRGQSLGRDQIDAGLGVVALSGDEALARRPQPCRIPDLAAAEHALLELGVLLIQLPVDAAAEVGGSRLMEGEEARGHGSRR